MFALVNHWIALARTASQRRQAIESLSRLSDAQLSDVGLERGTIEESVRSGMPWPVYEHLPRSGALRPSIQGCG